MAAKSKVTVTPKDRLLPRVTVAFFERPLLTGLLWLVLIVFGILSYTTLLKREGFPSVNIPLAVVNGTYFVNDPAKVDSQVAEPLSAIALKQAGVTSVSTQSSDNFYVLSVQYKEGTDAKAATEQLKQTIASSGKLPAQANIQYNVPNFGATGGDIEKIDVALSFYSTDGKASTQQLTAQAEKLVANLNSQKIAHVEKVFLKNPFSTVVDPATGQPVTVQRNFDRFGLRETSDTQFFNSVLIGVTATSGADVIKLDEAVRQALNKSLQDPQFSNYHAEVSASFAPSIKDNIGELQKVLIEGLIAVLIIGSIVIAIRASLITVISMVTVLLTTLGFLYLLGYTLNVITLFALILGLALIVDDTIIMVEAIDSARKQHKDRRTIILTATRKISRAMVAATLTAALCFMPLAFVGGVLGSFIRAIPITLIASLLISLFVALIFIPFFSRFLLLGKKQLTEQGVKEVSAGFEAKLAHFITWPMRWARHHKGRLTAVIITAVLVGLTFIIAGFAIARNVVFNIFPPTKDTNALVLSMSFPPGLTIDQANQVASQADKLAADVIGSNYVQSSYYNTGSTTGGTSQVEIISYSKRDVTSQELVQQLQTKFDNDFKAARVVVGQSDVGPPAAAFVVQVDGTNREAAYRAALGIKDYMSTAELKRPNGSVAHFTNITVSNPGEFLRTDNRPIVTVSASFDATDTTTLVTLAQTAMKEAFPDSKQISYGLKAGSIQFDIGQESENQNSFKTLALAFPILLVVIFLLLAVEFRSFLQPLLIFMAIPFSIFGVMLGLDLTNNAISFFTMLGFFALVGLSIKNTILLTDYANQARRQGMEPIDAAAAALEERFRPLFATSLTAVVSLIPLAISSPFWQGLSVVLIFGLLSSTFLVVTVFPYYYLGAEYARLAIPARRFFMWLVPTVALTIVAAKLFGGAIAALVFGLGIVFVPLYLAYKKRLSRKPTFKARVSKKKRR